MAALGMQQLVLVCLFALVAPAAARAESSSKVSITEWQRRATQPVGALLASEIATSSEFTAKAQPHDGGQTEQQPQQAASAYPLSKVAPGAAAAYYANKAVAQRLRAGAAGRAAEGSQKKTRDPKIDKTLTVMPFMSAMILGCGILIYLHMKDQEEAREGKVAPADNDRFVVKCVGWLLAGIGGCGSLVSIAVS